MKKEGSGKVSRLLGLEKAWKKFKMQRRVVLVARLFA